jgi:hypothetical protein
MNWNLPYNALAYQFPQLMDCPSPSAMSVPTPNDVTMESPEAETALSPGLAQAVSLRRARQNADMFVTGDFEGLLRAFDSDDKKCVQLAFQVTLLTILQAVFHVDV